MASELVGSAHVDIDINPSPAEAALARLEAKADRTFADLGRKRAEATLDVKTTDFDRKINKAKGELADLEGKHARVGVSLKGDIEKEIAEVKAEIKQLDREKATIKVDASQVKAANKEQRLLSQARALDERHSLAQAKAERALVVEREKGIDTSIKSRAAIAKLSAEYEKLAGKQKALKKSASSVFSQRSIATTEREARKLERVGAEMEHVAHKIERLGGSVADLDPELRKNSNAFDRWISKLGDTSIRIGPLTTSLKGLGVGMGLLGPLIFELGGGLASLIGFLGQGLAGAATVGVGALGGFALSALGVGAIIKPMIGEFGDVKKASESLADAQLKYGKNSEQARTAQEKLNNSLKGVSPGARSAFEDYGKLGDQWRSMTKDAKPAVFDAVGQSIKTAGALLPMFARESVATTKVAGKAWEGWMKSLRSSEAKGLLGGMMSDFRASIPGLAEGLASIGAMIGRIGAAGAHFLPGLSDGFAEWANNLERSVGGGEKLTGKVGGLVDSMRDFGHLTQDTGSFLVHFFGAGADAGEGLSDSLDHVITRWDKWAQSAEGKSSLKSFFSESQDATEDFMSSLGHFTELLFQFSRATAPLANGLLKVVTFIGDIVQAADGLVGVKNIFQAIGIGLGSLWVASKVTAYASAVRGAAAAIKGFAVAQGAADLAGAAGGGGLFGFGRKAKPAAEATEGLARGLFRVGPAAAGATAELGVMAAALAPEVLIPAAAIGALALFIGKMEDSKTAFEEAHEAFMQTEDMKQSIENITNAGEHYNESLNQQVSATKAAADAKQHYLKLVNNGAPERKIMAALAQLNQAERQQATNARNMGIERAENVKTDEKALRTAEKRVAAAKAQERAARKTEPKLDNAGNVIQAHQSANWEKELARAQRERAAAQREVAATATALVTANLPLERQTKGLAPITDKAVNSLQKLGQTVGAQAAKKIGNFVDPKDVERAANLSNRLTKLGQGSQVKKIAVKSSGADETLSKLQRLQKQTSRVTTARLNVKTNSEGASQKLAKLSSLSQKVAGANPTIKILANAENAEQAIQRLSGHLRQVAQKKYQARIDAIDNTTAPGSKAQAKLLAIAKHQYRARLEAIDNASHPAAAARKALEQAGKQHPNPTISVNAAQALSSTQMVIGQLSALNGYTAHANVYVGLSGPGAGKIGRFMGGPSVYMPSFAVGGPSQDRLQRAAENAVLVPAGASRKVNKPTMLTGEEPGHPEYVIATNPAYRESNERYLESAAGDLGYEVIPAYAKGGSKKKSGSGSGSSAAKKSGPGKKPPSISHRTHHYIKTSKLNDKALVNEQHGLEKASENAENAYNTELDHEEREIAAGRLDNWNYSMLRGFKQTVASSQQQLHNKTIPNLIGKIQNQQTRAEDALKGTRSQLSQVGGTIGQMENDYDKMEKNKHENQKDFNTKKLHKKHEINEWKKTQKALKKARENEEALIKEAKKEISELRSTFLPNSKNALTTARDDVQYINDVETNVVDAPYEEAPDESDKPKPMDFAKADLLKAEIGGDIPGAEAARAHMVQIAQQNFAAALGTPDPFDDIETGEELKSLLGGSAAGGPATIGEQTASLSAARQSLFAQFASNITTGGGSPNYLPGASAVGGLPGEGSALPGGGPGTVNNVTNNFGAPPPDPHTWTKQQTFELGALA